MSARAWWCAVWLVGVAAQPVSCRDISVCSDGWACRTLGGASGLAGASEDGSGGVPAQGGSHPSGGASDHGGTQSGGGASPMGSSGDRAGAAGGQGELSCVPPLANCDQTRLDGCETDLFGDADHCGACKSPCQGVCARGGCHLPVSAGATNQELLGDFAVLGEALYFTWGPYEGPFRLSRVEKPGEAARLLADGLPEFSHLVVTPNELFLWGATENLRSSDLNGVMVDQGFEVSGVAAVSDAAYAGSKGILLERRMGETSWEATRWFTAEDATTLWPLAVDDQLVVFRIIASETAPRYEVLLVSDRNAPDGGLRTLAKGNGVPTRIRALRDAYWIVQLPNSDSRSFELHRHSLDPKATTQLLASERDITNFALDDSFVYVTRSLGLSYELVLIPVSSISEKYRFGSHIELAHPESIGEQLWFYDPSLQQVRSVDLGLNDFL